MPSRTTEPSSNPTPDPTTTPATSQGVPNPATTKTGAEEAADRLYEERIEEEYAKREGGA